ncbi:MAG: hypothetical protein AB7I33_15165 [Gemmatimonadales bacterium]
MGETLIPIFGMITGLLMTGALIFGVVRIMQSPVGQALARRIQGRHGDDDDLRHEVAELREQVEYLHQELGEAQERLDFTERLLSRVKEEPRLPGAG